MFQTLLPITVAMLPALLPPLLVLLYFRRFDDRKSLISRLLATMGEGRTLRRETGLRRDEWEKINLISIFRHTCTRQRLQASLQRLERF